LSASIAKAIHAHDSNVATGTSAIPKASHRFPAKLVRTPAAGPDWPFSLKRMPNARQAR
jgi:hypothetical protein